MESNSTTILGAYLVFKDNGEDKIIHSDNLSPLFITKLVAHEDILDLSREGMLESDAWVDLTTNLSKHLEGLIDPREITPSISMTSFSYMGNKTFYQPILSPIKSSYSFTDIVSILDKKEEDISFNYTIADLDTFYKGSPLGSDDVFYSALTRR